MSRERVSQEIAARKPRRRRASHHEAMARKERVAVAPGEHVRLARSAAGMLQREVAIRAGVSGTMVCRMELGQGGSIGLDSWAAVAAVLGVELVADFREPAGSLRGQVEMRCHRLVASVAGDGGWVARTEIVRASPDRAPSSVETILVRPFRTEAAVVHAWHPGPDVGAALGDLGARCEQLRRSLGPGWSVSALVLCPSTTAGRRRVTEVAERLAAELPANGSDWMGALRHKRSPMPAGGLLWTDRWAERFRPAARHPGWQRPV
jgi:transcriptional regulator with XRE-family HTH domain